MLWGLSFLASRDVTVRYYKDIFNLFTTATSEQCLAHRSVQYMFVVVTES